MSVSWGWEVNNEGLEPAGCFVLHWRKETAPREALRSQGSQTHPKGIIWKTTNCRRAVSHLFLIADKNHLYGRGMTAGAALGKDNSSGVPRTGKGTAGFLEREKLGHLVLRSTSCELCPCCPLPPELSRKNSGKTGFQPSLPSQTRTEGGTLLPFTLRDCRDASGHSQLQVEADVSAAGSPLEQQNTRSCFESASDCARHQDAPKHPNGVRLQAPFVLLTKLLKSMNLLMRSDCCWSTRPLHRCSAACSTPCSTGLHRAGTTLLLPAQLHIDAPSPKPALLKGTPLISDPN